VLFGKLATAGAFYDHANNFKSESRLVRIIPWFDFFFFNLVICREVFSG
jgi:hypothetical protein